MREVWRLELRRALGAAGPHLVMIPMWVSSLLKDHLRLVTK